MMNYGKKIFFLTLFVIIISEDTLLFGTNNNILFIAARFILYFIMLFFCFNGQWKHINKRAGISVLIIGAIFLCTMLLNRDFRNGYFLQLLGVILALKIASIIKLEEFMMSFSKIIYYLSIISISLFLLIFIAPSIINSLPTITNYGDVDFATIIVSNIIKKDGLLRNSSVFREPGIFGIYLTICLLYEFFYIENFNFKKVIVFFIALITTFSTTAFLALGLIIIGYILQAKNFKMKLYLSIGVILFLAFILPSIYDSIFSKFDSDATDYRSALSRFASFSVPAAIFQDHPLGVGLSNFVNLYPVYAYNLFNIELKPEGEATNTFINTFAIYGVVYGVILVYAVWGLSRQYYMSTVGSLIIFVIYILLFSSQELRFSMLFNILVIYGVMYRKNGLKKNSMNPKPTDQ